MSKVSFGVAFDSVPSSDSYAMVPNCQKSHRVTFAEEEIPIWTAATTKERQLARHYMRKWPSEIIAELALKIIKQLLGPDKASIAQSQAREIILEAARTGGIPRRDRAEWVYLGYLDRLTESCMSKYKATLISDLKSSHFSRNPNLAELVANKICDENLRIKLYQKIFRETLSLKELIKQFIPSL